MSLVRTASLSLLLSPSLSAQTELLRVPGAPSDFSGQSCAAVGDIDGDGVPDLIVGSPQGNAGGSAGGFAQVLSGRDGGVIHDVRGSSAGDNFGWSVDGAGDVDADGTPDYVVGGPRAPGTGLAGYAKVYSGATGALLYTFGDGGADSFFGIAVSAAGDLDADGHDDVLVGASSADPGGRNNAGQAWAYSGFDGSLLFSWSGLGAQDYFGLHLCELADLDLDGHDDVAIAADYSDLGGVQSGAVFLFSGADGSSLGIIQGNSGDTYGSDVSSAGDLNQDGIPDVLVGALGSGNGGEAFVFSGADGSLLATLGGVPSARYFGWSVDAAGDVDGDGRPDYLVGDILDQERGFENGAVWLFSGAGGVLGVVRGVVGDSLGMSVAGLGDVTGDGRGDFVAGAHQGSYAAIYSGVDCVAAASNYGAGWPGTQGVPGLRALGPPAIGSTMRLVLENSSGQPTPTMVFYGTQEASIPTNRGGTLLVHPIGSLFLGLPVPDLQRDLRIPTDTSLCGRRLLLQALEVDAGASHGLSFTRGLRVEFGGR